MSLPNVVIKQEGTNYSIKPHHWFNELKPKQTPTKADDAKPQFWVKDHWQEFGNKNSMQFGSVQEMEDFAMFLLNQVDALRCVEEKMQAVIEAKTHYCENGQFKEFPAEPKAAPAKAVPTKSEPEAVSKMKQALSF